MRDSAGSWAETGHWPTQMWTVRDTGHPATHKSQFVGPIEPDNPQAVGSASSNTLINKPCTQNNIQLA